MPVINPLHAMHEQAEAAFLPYGPDLQIVESYGEVEAEYAAIRKAVAIMDAPHRGTVIVTGKDRLGFLNNLVTNDTHALIPGQGVYAYLLNTKGRITMDMNILQSEDATVLEVDARLTGTLCKQLEKHRFAEDVKFMDASTQLARLSLIGPQAGKLLGHVTEGGVQAIAPLTEPLRHARSQIARNPVTIFRLDLCGEAGYELIVPRDQLVQLWQVLHEAGADQSESGSDFLTARAIGWSAFNTARIETGTPLFAIDLTEDHLPMETAHWYPRAVSMTKGCYLGQEVVARMQAHDAVARLFVGLRVQGDKLPIAGTDILGGEGGPIGMITSSCMSPMLGLVPVAMGYVKRAYAQLGGTLEVLAEGHSLPARVVSLPFWQRQA